MLEGDEVAGLGDGVLARKGDAPLVEMQGLRSDGGFPDDCFRSSWRLSSL